MKKYIVGCLAIFGVFAQEPLLKRENIPSFDPQATQIIYYSTTKDLSEGALKRSLLLDLKRFFNIEVFVESGTFRGDTTEVAAMIFSEVHSIEIFPEFYSAAQNRLAYFPNVFLHLNDSGRILDTLFLSLEQKTLFYLDGHYDGGSSGRGERNTPIREELAAIEKAGRGFTSVILIDDIADFQDTKYPQRVKNTCFEEYPDLKELLSALLRINPDYQICFLGNALLAFPKTAGVCASIVLSACAMDILSAVEPHLFSNEELLRAEALIAASSGEERSELIHYYSAYGLFEQHYGWRSFSTFWYGLLLQNSGKIKAAKRQFRAAEKNSLPGWRINFYKF